MLISIKKENYKECLEYIETYWTELICHHPRDRFIHLGLPNKFVTPSKGIFSRDQFYWDSYFTILGLVKCGRVELAKGMVDNLVFLFKKFNIVPMRNRFYNIGISQIPFLSSMALEVYEETKDKRWLSKVLEIAEKELEKYWMNKELTEMHIVYNGLSRYCDHYITHLGAEHESGWDMTSRFNNHCLNYLPVDLNSCLYKYQMDISKIAQFNKTKTKSNSFELAAKKRLNEMNELMWNEKKGFYFDYNYKTKRKSTFYSLAGFYPLWAEMATPDQANKVRENLHLFEYKGGLANTQVHGLGNEFKQHDYPNGWAQQHWIVIKGLLNYGFTEDAKRIAKKWLDLNKEVFISTGKFWEKYNVVNCKIGESNMDRYPIQSGFGWTNAIFIRLLFELGE